MAKPWPTYATRRFVGRTPSKMQRSDSNPLPPPPTVSNAKRPKNKRGLSLPAASHSDRVSTISGVRRPCVPCSDSAYCGRFNFDLGASTFIVEEKKGIECVFGRVEGENQGFLLLLFFCDEIARSLLRIAMTDDDSRGR